MDRENKAYQKVLAHRKNCPKWGKEFCLECFGGGLNRFVDNFHKEERKELGLPSVEEMVRRNLAVELSLIEARKDGTEDRCKCGFIIPRGYGYYNYRKKLLCLRCGRKNQMDKIENLEEFKQKIDNILK